MFLCRHYKSSLRPSSSGVKSVLGTYDKYIQWNADPLCSNSALTTLWIMPLVFPNSNGQLYHILSRSIWPQFKGLAVKQINHCLVDLIVPSKPTDLSWVDISMYPLHRGIKQINHDWVDLSATKTYRVIQEIDLYPMDLGNDVLQISVRGTELSKCQ